MTPSRLPITLLLSPVLSTLVGGWIALRMERYRALLTALGAGLLLGTAFLDLLPEAFTLARSVGEPHVLVPAVTLLAFLVFLLLDSLLGRLGAGGDRFTTRRIRGRISGGLLILHSFRDGMVIGAAYSASRAAGLVVALGIVAHDIGDGMNTVLLSTAGERAWWGDYALLLADALAPLLGGLLTVWWVQSPRNAVVLLAVAAGFFLQMATGAFLPQGRDHAGVRWFTVPVALVGVALIYGANLLLGEFSR